MSLWAHKHMSQWHSHVMSLWAHGCMFQTWHNDVTVHTSACHNPVTIMAYHSVDTNACHNQVTLVLCHSQLMSWSWRGHIMSLWANTHTCQNHATILSCHPEHTNRCLNHNEWTGVQFQPPFPAQWFYLKHKVYFTWMFPPLFVYQKLKGDLSLNISLLVQHPSNTQTVNRDGAAKQILCAATRIYKLKINLQSYPVTEYWHQANQSRHRSSSDQLCVPNSRKLTANCSKLWSTWSSLKQLSLRK